MAARKNTKARKSPEARGKRIPGQEDREENADRRFEEEEDRGGEDGLDFEEMMRKLADMLEETDDEDEDDVARHIRKEYIREIRTLNDGKRELFSAKEGRYRNIPAPPKENGSSLADQMSNQIGKWFQEHPEGKIRVVRGKRTIRELLSQLNEKESYDFCKYLLRYDDLKLPHEKRLDIIRAEYEKYPEVFLYPQDPVEMDLICRLLELAAQGGECQAKDLGLLVYMCGAAYQEKTETLELASDLETLLEKISAEKVRSLKKELEEFDRGFEILMKHYGVLEMEDVPEQLKENFRQEYPVRQAMRIIYWRHSFTKKVVTFTMLNSGRCYVIQHELDPMKIMKDPLMVAMDMMPYWKIDDHQLRSWKRTGDYMDVFPGWSYLMGLLVVNAQVDREEAREICDEIYVQARNGASLGENMEEIGGEQIRNSYAVRMLAWEIALHCLLGVALPGLKGANRVVASRLPAYRFSLDDLLLSDEVKEEKIGRDTPIEKMPQQLQQEIGSRLFTLEEGDLQPMRKIRARFPNNTDINYLLGVCYERLGYQQDAVNCFEKADRLSNGKHPDLKLIIAAVKAGHIRKPVSLYSDGTLFL